MQMQLASKAKVFSLLAHRGQCRPNASHEPMAVHLSEVASYVTDESGDEVAIACAWLHDVVEDTSVTLTEIGERFGQRLSGFVEMLTDPPDWATKDLAERKERQALRIATAPNLVKLVKLADQISNIRSVIFDPPLEWGQDECITYVRGASLVGRACAGVSQRLDTLLEHYVCLARQPNSAMGKGSLSTEDNRSLHLISRENP